MSHYYYNWCYRMNIVKTAIIIPVYNEEKNLINLFESIVNQDLNRNIVISNIIVVDNGSIDNSVLIASKYCTEVFILPGATIAELRNYGAAHCCGEILIFMDADCRLASDVVSNVAELLSDKTIAAIGPDGLIPPDRSTWVQQTWYLHTRMLSDEQQNIEVENLSSGFFAITAQYFNEVGGFNGELSIGEDTDISRKLRSKGFKLIKTNRLCVYNSGHPATIIKFLKREYWHGDSFRHLLIHKKIDLLTVYFIINFIVILISLAAMLLFKSIQLLLIYVIASGLVLMFKAIKKVPRIGLVSFKLFLLYFLYVNARSAALFKCK